MGAFARLAWRLGAGRRGASDSGGEELAGALGLARVPYLAYSGDALAAPSTSTGRGRCATRALAARVCTTGVGTPSSDRLVTAASPIPIEVSSASTS